MKNRIVAVLFLVFFSGGLLSAESYKSDHFVIYTDLHPQYAEYIQANAEAYYKNFAKKYFLSGWENDPLKIYLSRTQEQARKLIKVRGYGNPDQYYDPNAPVIYAFCVNDKNEHIGMNMLLEHMIRHFMHINSQKGPDWFKDELVSFLTNCTAISEGELAFTTPVPCGQVQLSESLNSEGIRDNIQNLYSRSAKKYEEWLVAKPFTQTFFCWLCEENKFKKYIQEIHKQDYKIGVLEEVTGERYGDIKLIMSDFMQKYCAAAACMEKALAETDPSEKERLLIEALKSSPRYRAAVLELARCYYRTGQDEKCIERLEEILIQKNCCEYRSAARLAGDIYYNKKNYNRALEYYLSAWNKSGFYEYQYRLPYRIANCYYYMDDTAKAGQWYKTFLEKKWCREEMVACSDYAKKFIDRNPVINQ